MDPSDDGRASGQGSLNRSDRLDPQQTRNPQIRMTVQSVNRTRPLPPTR